MAVHPGSQRKGVGRLLLKQAEAVARFWPADAIRLDAFDAAAGAGPYLSQMRLPRPCPSDLQEHSPWHILSWFPPAHCKNETNVEGAQDLNVLSFPRALLSLTAET